MSVVGSPLKGVRLRYPEIDLSSEVGSISPKVAIVDDYLFVAVAKQVKDNRSTVIWALQNSGGKKICILHVHTPSHLGKSEDIARHEKEKKEMLEALDEYIKLCAKAGVKAQKLFIEGESIENGIITLITQNMIGRLVMGAAADNRYGWGMTQPKSKKSLYVLSQAPAYCHISFVCKGNLIHIREGVKPASDQGIGEMNFLRSPLRTKTEFSDSKSDIYKSSPRMSNVSSPDSEDFTRKSVSESARPSTSSDAVKGSMLARESYIFPRRGESAFAESPPETEYFDYSSPPHLLGRSMDNALYDKLEKLMAEVDTLRKEAYLESMKRTKAETETLEATRKAKVTESLYYEEQKRRTELEEKLAKERREFEILNNQHNKILEEFRAILHLKSSLESEIVKSNLLVEKLDEKLFSAVGLLEKYRKERDDMELELDNALLETERLMRQLSRFDPTTRQVSNFFADFTYLEILEATDNMNLLRKIGEGGFGNTYKGVLRRTEVAIKVLSLDSLQGPQEFKQEVETLSKLRHPNIVTLIGVCSEASALIYEYLPNGSLEDRLSCKDKTPPLTWQTRICIAAELCSVLMFMHSCQPESIIHGDLKPANVLLDSRLSCKLSDFGICRAIDNNTTRFYRTDPKGTFAYMDPEFISTGELNTKSDVYSFGIILLQLLTGKSTLGIIHEVQNALDNENLDAVLDHSAGEWPFVQANQLALLGLRCCEMQRIKRPDLEADVWRVLEPMRISSGSSAAANLGRDESDYVPSYFMCPIFQEVMQDPQIAADGFTYEAEALKGWLDSGHDTSPMTNLKLQNQTLIPNRALRSAIQEWLQRR